MTYQETLQYLYHSLPVFEHDGAHAYKPGLARCEAMDALLGKPHERYRTVHVAGTNGKGSTSHLLAAVLQAAGYRVGLFTSPHLLDFGERIRVQGAPIDEAFVVDWVARWAVGEGALLQFAPTFFELATMMAFDYFAAQKVDVAVVEVGLGGRLDSTNIIRPALSVITNISLDHTQFLGNTLPEIAAEKAGIMKEGVPVVIGECNDEAVRQTFVQHARMRRVKRLVFASDDNQIPWVEQTLEGYRYQTAEEGTLSCPLAGDCQPHNANTVLVAIGQLREEGFHLTPSAVAEGFAGVIRLTHLRGRWETLAVHPDGTPSVIADTGHNTGCFAYLAPRLARLAASGTTLHVVFGMMADKDTRGVLAMLPHEATYHWCAPDTPRALTVEALQAQAEETGLHGIAYPTVADALQRAYTQVKDTPQTLLFVGGSNYVVCEALRMFSQSL